MDRSQDEGGEPPNSWAQGNTYNEIKDPLQSGEYSKFDEFHECAESPNSSAEVWSAVNFFKKQGWSNRARNKYY